jgi:hypothetical protein
MRPFVLLTILLVFACGCRYRTTPAGVNSGSGSSGSKQDSVSFSGRLEAAKAIFDSNKRDAALAKVALDAAEAGEGDVAKQAVKSIFDSNSKDKAAYNAAVALTKAGKANEAKAVADMIFDSNRKDAAMTKIAEGG